MAKKPDPIVLNPMERRSLDAARSDRANLESSIPEMRKQLAIREAALAKAIEDETEIVNSILKRLDIPGIASLDGGPDLYSSASVQEYLNAVKQEEEEAAKAAEEARRALEEKRAEAVAKAEAARLAAAAQMAEQERERAQARAEAAAIRTRSREAAEARAVADNESRLLAAKQRDEAIANRAVTAYIQAEKERLEAKERASRRELLKNFQDQVKAEEPKAEEPKAEEPKAEEPKAEEQPEVLVEPAREPAEPSKAEAPADVSGEAKGSQA